MWQAFIISEPQNLTLLTLPKMKPILEIKNIAKRFDIRHRQGSYLNLRESLTSLFKPQRVTYEDFYALRDISFDVNPGESVGIIGRNGAGKSTLLKILSKITPPTSGRIISRGRIASLLEVGTGFHPELSGRENIFLNGSILGMSRREINAKFDEIVDFSGTEKFLDTPLKHYSSGMQLRLAFAVAAFLEPEVLIIDEVLAVGDAEFQKKCMGKMESVSKSGRTILFVSHNLSAVSNLCSRAIMLKSGLVEIDGTPNETISHYLASSDNHDHSGVKAKVIYSHPGGTWEKNTSIRLEFEWDNGRFGKDWTADLAVYTYDNTKLFALQSQKISSRTIESDKITFEIINPGFVYNDIRVDFGIRKDPSSDYALVVNNILTIHSGIANVAPYARHDVIVVPEVTVAY